MYTHNDDVIFLGEISCPEPYAAQRVPVYRVVRDGHSLFGQVITEQQVLQEGLYHTGLAPRSIRQLDGVRKTN
jgi:hypothetical protein